MAHKITNSFSLQMAASIPKKIKSWLETITGDTEDDSVALLPFGSFGRLSWQFNEDNVCGIYLDQQPIIWWNSADVTPEFYVGNLQLTDISNNLDYFVDLEQQIYAELEKLQQELNKHEYIKTKEPEYTHYLKVQDEKH